MSNTDIEDSKAKMLAALPFFTGTEAYHRLPGFPYPALLTDGALYVAQQGNAFWLMTAILSHQITPSVRAEACQFWKLTVHDDRTASLICTDGNGMESGHVLARQDIEYTDFPLDEIEVWAFQDEGLGSRVLLLPSEY